MEQTLVTILTDVSYSWRELPKHLFKLIKIRFRKFFYYTELTETIESLERGFSQLKITYRIDPWGPISGTVVVFGSPEALVWALLQKKKGVIKKVIAGPGISTLPSDHNNLIANPDIDVVLLPTDAIKTRWTQIDQYFEKAVVWSAGVENKRLKRIESAIGGQACVVYSRNADEKLFKHIMEVLWDHKVPIIVSNYGTFRTREYIHLLRKAKFLIYLDNFASQPLPLYEAWMANVPSIVMGQPVEPGCGLSFDGVNDFEAKLLEFQERVSSYNPRQYALTHHTDSISAGKLRSIL